MSGITVFVPCRAGSVRVPDKNTRPFAGHSGGLLGLKLDQLASLSGIDVVVVDSNDPRILERASARQRTWSGQCALRVVERPDHLGRSETTTDALIAYALERVETEELLWTHVTSPLMGTEAYARVLAAWRGRDHSHHDSLMTVTPIHAFLWQQDGPLNYARSPVRWPRTQDIAPVFEVNSAAFIVPTALGRRRKDRVGERPLLFPLGKIESLDVDWPEDFAIAEHAFMMQAKTKADSEG